MPLLDLIALVIVIGVAVLAVTLSVKMDSGIARIIRIVGSLAAVGYVLYTFRVIGRQ